jgi:hypothetical protein
MMRIWLNLLNYNIIYNIPQVYFERPLQYYLNLAFRNGFVLDGFAERAFPPDTPQSSPLSWGDNYSEIPPVMVLRMRRL